MNKKILFLILLAVVLVLPFHVYAKELTEMVVAVKSAAITIGTTLVVVGWVIAGILYLTAVGSPEKMGTAKKALIAAIIGTVLVVIANSGVDVIKGLVPGLFDN